MIAVDSNYAQLAFLLSQLRRINKTRGLVNTEGPSPAVPAHLNKTKEITRRKRQIVRVEEKRRKAWQTFVNNVA